HIIEEVFDEIHRSNLSKLDENGNPIYREDGKVIKGPNYFPPDIKKIIEKNYGKEIVPYATCNLNLAEVYRFMKKFDEIEELYLETMEIYRKNNLHNDYLYASVCNNLGLFYQDTGRYQDALDLHKKSLEILEKLPEYKLQYATTLSNMVLPYLKTGEKEKSEDVLDKSLKLIENTVGKEHGLYSASLNNMAIQYYNEGEFEKALKYFEESAEICKKSFGENSGNYKSLLQNIEIVKERLGENE
ncbi:MAG: tetratricopeptide repeat protein, partial [Leptotrichia sp.]|nr:tetratricopeptide repeat protein [Leptotrichia sp.]